MAAETSGEVKKVEADNSTASNEDTNENGKNNVAGSAPEGHMSKRQLRKLEKMRKWKESENFRKEKRMQKKKEYKERRKQYLETLKNQAAEKGIEPNAVVDPNSRKRLKSNSMKNSSCKVGICIDMSFTDLMIDKDLHKCIKQVHRSYSINRRYENPVQFYVTSFAGKAADVMGKHDGWRNWDVNFNEKSYLELEEYPKDQIVYLTAESNNVLTEPEDGKLYVIGGLVDHNSKKGLCHKLALEKGLQTARLPLGEYVDTNARKVLTIDHVFKIVGSKAQGRPWEEVLMEVLPPRTQPKLKRPLSESGSNSDNEDEDTDKGPDNDTTEIKVKREKTEVETTGE